MLTVGESEKRTELRSLSRLAKLLAWLVLGKNEVTGLPGDSFTNHVPHGMRMTNDAMREASSGSKKGSASLIATLPYSRELTVW